MTLEPTLNFQERIDTKGATFFYAFGESTLADYLTGKCSWSAPRFFVVALEFTQNRAAIIFINVKSHVKDMVNIFLIVKGKLSPMVSMGNMEYMHHAA